MREARGWGEGAIVMSAVPVKSWCRGYQFRCDGDLSNQSIGLIANACQLTLDLSPRSV